MGNPAVDTPWNKGAVMSVNVKVQLHPVYRRPLPLSLKEKWSEKAYPCWVEDKARLESDYVHLVKSNVCN